jgi:hypothetical protein
MLTNFYSCAKKEAATMERGFEKKLSRSVEIPYRLVAIP